MRPERNDKDNNVHRERRERYAAKFALAEERRVW